MQARHVRVPLALRAPRCPSAHRRARLTCRCARSCCARCAPWEARGIHTVQQNRDGMGALRSRYRRARDAQGEQAMRDEGDGVPWFLIERMSRRCPRARVPALRKAMCEGGHGVPARTGREHPGHIDRAPAKKGWGLGCTPQRPTNPDASRRKSTDRDAAWHPSHHHRGRRLPEGVYMGYQAGQGVCRVLRAWWPGACRQEPW
jgi:hypothetical protein